MAPPNRPATAERDPAPGRAQTLNAADHGIVPGVDVTPMVNRLLDRLRGEPDVTLAFPEGRYDFYPENAVEAYRAVTNHDNSLKRMAFALRGCRGLTVDGGGSQFVFHGRIVPFAIDHAAGITLKNFTIDWDRPFHNEMTVVAHDGEGFVVEIDPDAYPHRVADGELIFRHDGYEDATGANIVFDPQTRAPIFDTGDYQLPWRGVPARDLGHGRVRIGQTGRKAPPIGSVLVTYGDHPTSRLVPAIHADRSQDLRLEDVTVRACGGMALIAERCEDLTLTRFHVTSAPGRSVSARADATHFMGCRGTVTLEDCTLEHMLDDGINVHGTYVRVEANPQGRELLCATSHFQQYGCVFAEPGDAVAILSRETLRPLFETVVEAVEVLNEQRMVVTLAELPDGLTDGPLSLENLTWNPDVVMRGCTVHENRARGALITTRGRVLIENNTFSNQMHGVLIEGDNNHWYESGGVRDVTITNNRFVDIGFGGQDRIHPYPLCVSPLLTADQRFDDTAYHRGIRFVNNVVESFNGHLVFGRSVGELEVRGNRMTASDRYPASRLKPTVDLDHTDGVTLSGNTADGFAAPADLHAGPQARGVSAENNRGFTGP